MENKTPMQELIDKLVYYRDYEILTDEQKKPVHYAINTASEFLSTERVFLKDWQDECERLAGVAKFWQEEYYKINPGFTPPKIDNL